MNRREFLAGMALIGTGPRILSRQIAGVSVALTRHPYIQNTRANAATIMWATPVPADGIVGYSSDFVNFRYVRAERRVMTSAEVTPLSAFTQFRADLTELDPGTDYAYQVYVESQLAAQGGFRTAGDGSFKFLVFGDTGQLTAEQARVGRRIAADPAAFLVHVGDIAYFQGSQKDFQACHFDVYKHILSNVTFFPCPGNHEYMTPNAAAYISSHAVPTNNVPVPDRGRYYSFDWSNAHFVCLDSIESLLQAVGGTGQMLRWLESDLRATRKFWRIAAFHHPPYASGFNQSDPLSALARDHIVPILERYGVQVVFSGHEHSYQRSVSVRRGAAAAPGTGTIYVTSGGGGAALYPVLAHPLIEFGASMHHYMRVTVSGTEMKITAVASSGSPMEEYLVQPRPGLQDEPGVPAVTIVPSGRGTLIRIRGRSLAAEEVFVRTPPGPSEVAGVVVLVNQQPLSLIYVSPTQIWAQLPPGVQPPFQLSVASVNGSIDTFV